MAYGSILNFSTIFSADSRLWNVSAAVHIPSEGALRCWICRDADAPLLVLFPDSRRARDFVCDAKELKLFKNPELLPEFAFTDEDAQNSASSAKRGSVMSRFKSGAADVLVSTPSALTAPFLLGGDNFELVCGETVDRQQLVAWLEGKGYERCDLVWSPGQFALRGSIVDVFSPSDSYPLRIEFFDDEIESLRRFVSDTQKSLGTVSSAALQGLNGSASAKFYEMFPANMKVIYFDPAALDSAAENDEWLRNNLAADAGMDISDWPLWQDVRHCLSKYGQLRAVRDIDKADVRLDTAAFPYFRGKTAELNAFCSNLAKEGFRITAVSDTEANLNWAEKCGYQTQRGLLSGGFVDRSSKTAVITDVELSGMSVRAGGAEKRAPKDWGETLRQGQWVTHEDYGLAHYAGSQLVETPSGLQEYIALNFANEQRLLVPLMQFYKISPYVPYPGEEPAADTLRGTRWRKSSEDAREAAAQAAKDLSEIYAKRELSSGYKFESHRDLMKELEDGFSYTETADQLKAINDVISDMESAAPMDRLLVGDVGFGKTEIALRAAGEAAFCGKQTALLVPTTLLASQHYQTFVSRFASLPVRVEVISRFVPAKKQEQILKDLADGRVDILIGTHRLLSSDVTFKNLGLLIVDEEHRFGVLHKEKLKKLTPGVDVLMLSATPIPRSLSLSLSGLRDISLLETPPQKRLPVITVVRRWSEELLKSAVYREKNRGGQIFFIHNRIKDIQERAVMLKRLFPKLNIAVAHSRTSEAELESIMDKFTLGEIDILLCTTIVESGLDIPSANTMIVDDAHELGIAQMYQLRGRVGRREEQAYAFLFYPEDVKLSREAEERLDAIAELDELGAGYRLAQTDLQLRGGGDVIGTAQHGHGMKVGYHKYCDMLSEEIARLKGETKHYADVQIAFPLTVPPEYLPQENLRVAFYRRMLKLNSLAEELELRAETEDRFGRIPAGVDMLLKLNAVRAELAAYGIDKITINRDECCLYGDISAIRTELKLPAGWFVKADGSVYGHGGFRGINELYSAINETKRAKSATIA